MANFRTTADLCDSALRTAGEVTNGNSPYESQVLAALDRVHRTIVSGGTIPLLKDSTVTVDEVWPWARSSRPLILELQPKVDTGTVTLTLGSEAGSFSSAPAASLAGWYLRIVGRSEILRIASHTAAATAFELDGAYPDESGTLSFEAAKLDYDLLPDYLVIDSTNNKVQFQETAGTTLTATLTSGTYTPSALASEVQTQMNATGGTPAYTVSYSATTRLFSIASDRAGGAVFVLVGTGDQASYSAHKLLGFDDANSTNAASVTGTYPLGGISRLIEPMKMHKNASSGGSISGVDSETFQRSYPLPLCNEGNPDRFAVLRESPDGVLTVRFNKFPREKTRVEVEYVATPRDLTDSSASIPLLPRKWVDVLEDAAVFYLFLAKSDDRAQVYANLVQGKLLAMISQHRGAQSRFGENFGQIVPRPDLTGRPRGKLIIGGYTS